MILVTGATGTVGSEVLAQVTAGGADTRALVRSPERADSLRGLDAHVVVGHFEDAQSLDAALHGVEVAFLVSPPSPAQVQQETAFIDAAARAGGVRIVKLAAIGVDVDGAGGRFVQNHREIGEHLRSSGVPYTVLAPNGFMQNLLRAAAPVQELGEFRQPGGSAPISHVDVRDVAAVAAHVLTSEGHEGATYTITGPEAVTYDHIAQELSAAIGRPVRYVDADPQEAREGLLSFGVPEWNADGVLELAAWYATGAAAVVTDEVSKATGRPARSVADFLAAHRGALR